MPTQYHPPTEAGIYVRKDDMWDSQGWTSTPNALVRDERIQWDARAAFTWMASHTSSFRLTSESLAEAGPKGRNHAREMLRELERFGWLTRHEYRNPVTGRYDVHVYHLHVQPVAMAERTYVPSKAKPRVGEFSQVSPATARVDAGDCGQLLFPQVSPATGKPGPGVPVAGVPGAGRVDAYKKTTREEPPYPRAAGDPMPVGQEPQQPAAGESCRHGRRSCRPCGTSPRAQERAAAAEDAAAKAQAVDQTRACRMCNPDGWQLIPGTPEPVSPWVRCDHVTPLVEVLGAEIAVTDPSTPRRLLPTSQKAPIRTSVRRLKSRGTPQSRDAARAELDASRTVPAPQSEGKSA